MHQQIHNDVFTSTLYRKLVTCSLKTITCTMVPSCVLAFNMKQSVFNT